MLSEIVANTFDTRVALYVSAFVRLSLFYYVPQFFVVVEFISLPCLALWTLIQVA